MNIDTEKAIGTVAKSTGVCKRRMLGRGRDWPTVEARMLLILLLFRNGMTDQMTAWAIKRERVTVCRSRNRALGLLDVSKTFRDKFDKIKETSIIRKA